MTVTVHQVWKCVVHRLQCLVSVFPFSCSCQSITTEWHKFSGTINVHALVTIRWFVMQLRWYVPGIGIFALNGPSWREFKDLNVSVYLIKRKDSNLSCSSKYPPHLWTSFVYNISSDHFIILPIYLMLVRKVTDLLLNQGACVAFPAICDKLSAVLYSPGLWYCNDVNRFMCRARLFTECPWESLDYSESLISKLFLNLWNHSAIIN